MDLRGSLKCFSKKVETSNYFSYSIDQLNKMTNLRFSYLLVVFCKKEDLTESEYDLSESSINSLGYQLMSQVAGRAGRTDLRGKVLIQTYNPHHNILQQVSVNAYKEMFKEQMNDRYNYHYPPIYRLIKITFNRLLTNLLYLLN